MNVTFDQFNANVLNKSINSLKKKLCKDTVQVITGHDSYK